MTEPHWLGLIRERIERDDEWRYDLTNARLAIRDLLAELDSRNQADIEAATNMTRNQVNLKAPGAYTELQRLAKSLGFVQTGGPRAGEGSVAKMMEAIARGELEVKPTEKRPESPT